MKKFLLFSALLAMSLTSVANEPYQRLSSTGSIKQINKSGHSTIPGRTTAVNNFTVKSEAPSNALEVPVKHSLGKNEPDNIKLYTSIDANADGQTWKIGGFTGYSVCLTSNSAVIDGSDDWMITPPIHLLPNTTYKFSFEEGCATTSSKGGKLEVKYGTAPTVEAMTNVIFSDPTHLLNSTTFAVNSNSFTVAAEGYYYFGFHAYSPKGGSAKVCNFSITDSSQEITPAAAGKIAYQLAPKGELKASVTYTPPTTNKDGEAIAELSKVEITVNSTTTPIILENVTPGVDVTFDVEMKNGFNKIEAVAFIKDVAGEKASVDQVYCGLDNPLPLTNLKITVSEDLTKATVSWDAVGEVGENGGYVDPAKVVYYIFDAFGSYYDPALATTTESSYTFDYSDMKSQDFIAYQVTAGMDEYYYSLEAVTDIVAIGPAEKMPFTESFANASLTQSWILDQASTQNGWQYNAFKDNDLQTNASEENEEPKYLNSQDGDNGFFFAMPMEKDAIFGIQSGNINIASAKNPVFEFWAQGQGSNIEMMVAKDGVNFETIKTIKFKETPTTGWTLYRLPLDEFKAFKNIRVELRLVAVDNTDDAIWSLPIDNISVRDLVDTDLRLFHPVVPEKVKAGENIEMSARIQNLGTKECANAAVEFSVNGEVQKTVDLEALAPNAIVPVSFSYTTNMSTPETLSINMKVVCTGDVESSNNSASADVTVTYPVYPMVSSLSGNGANGKVTLSWTAPDLISGSKPLAVVEDFENPEYTPLTISNFGDWTLYDGDGAKTYNILQETANPYQTQPQAFQLYNATIAGVPENSKIDADAHSGEQFLVAWSAAQQTNDNWLISPSLSGEAQTISFFAKSFTIAYPESIEVLYSTTDKEISSFIEVENIPNSDVVPEVWTEFKVELPIGAKYFAIHHNPYDTYALYVDDISYTGASSIPEDLAVVGYNIYRDGVKVNTEAITSTEAEDYPLVGVTDSKEYTFGYQVSPIYNYGEGRACEAVSVSLTSSVESIASDVDAPVEYYNLQGMKLSSKNLPAGIYIRSVAGKSEKVIIP